MYVLVYDMYFFFLGEDGNLGFSLCLAQIQLRRGLKYNVLKSKCIVGGDNGGQHHFPQGTSINFPLIELVLLSICAGKNLAFRHCLSFMQHLKKKDLRELFHFTREAVWLLSNFLVKKIPVSNFFLSKGLSLDWAIWLF